MIRHAWAVVLACTTISVLAAQETPPDAAAALRSFETQFVRGVREADLGALDAAAELVDALPLERRRPAAFGLGVRRAEILLKRGDYDACARVANAARDAARAAGADVYRGSSRLLVLLLLWQVLADAAFDDLVVDDVEFLDSTDAVAAARGYLVAPLQVLRADLALRRPGDAAAGLAILQDLAVSMRDDGVSADDPWRRKCLWLLAWHFIVRRDYTRAETWVRELPAEYGLYPKALIALRRGDFETARKAGERLARTHGGPFWGLVGDAREALGRFAEARSAYERLLATADARNRALGLGGIGDCYLGEWLAGRRERELLAQAARCFTDAIAALGGADTLYAAAESANLYAQLGRVREEQGELVAALRLYRRALAGVDAARTAVTGDVFGSSWLRAVKADDYLSCIDGILRVSAARRASSNAAIDIAATLASVELGKARMLLDWMLVPPTAEDPRALHRAVKQVALLDDPARLDDVLLDLERSRRSSRPPATAAPLDVDGVRRHLERSASATLVVSYWLGRDDAWCVWAEGGGAASVRGGLVRLGTRAAALEHLAAASGAVAAPDTDPWPALDAAAAFFLPLALHGPLVDCDRLVLCPDDRLMSLPFEAMRPTPDARPLGLADAVCERTPSLSVRDALLDRRSRGSMVCVVDSAAAVDDAARLGLPPLEFSTFEGDLVADAYADVVRLRGHEATMSRLAAVTGARAFDLVHVSSHAITSALVPTASLLLLADGPASIASLAELELDGSVLVLSACVTGRGEERGGEGQLGLIGWPLAAGARAAVAALWHLNQQATADLMGQFHALRASGRDELTAMRDARAVLAAAPQYAHPHYWAGFGVFGSVPAVGTQGRSTAWLLGLGALLAVVVAAWAMRRASRS